MPAFLTADDTDLRRATLPRGRRPMAHVQTALGGSEREGLLRHDAVRADGEGNDDVVVNDEQHPVAVGHVEIKDLMAVPGDAFELVAT
jgi:hypothetical protein